LLLKDTKSTEKVSLRQISGAIGSSSFGILIFIFTIPLALPIPHPPGFSTLFAIPVLFFSFQMIIGLRSAHLWFFGKIRVKKSTIESMSALSYKFIQRFFKFTKKRMNFFVGEYFSRVIGLLTFTFALSLLVPIPAIAFPSALGIVSMAVGLILQDGIVVLCGMCFGFLGLFTTTATLIWGKKILLWIKHFWMTA
jgi:hypothetical protein